MKQRIWNTDWFAGATVSVVGIVLIILGVLEGVERSAYDLAVRLNSRTPSDRIAVIAIDDASIQNLGRWPWPRSTHATLIDKLRGAKAVGYTVFFSEAQVDTGLGQIREALAAWDKSSLHEAVPADLRRLEVLVDTARDATRGRPGGQAVQDIDDFMRGSSLQTRLITDLRQMRERLQRAGDALTADDQLAGSLRNAGNVILTMPFDIAAPRGNPSGDLPAYVQRNALQNIGGASMGGVDMPVAAASVIPPIESLGEVAGIAHANVWLDDDGVRRREPLVIDYFGQMYPSLPLMLAARSLNLGIKDIQVSLGEGVRLGSLWLHTDPSLRMLTLYYGDTGGRPAFQVDSFYDVYTGRISAEKYRDRIVLVGATAVGVATPAVTPVTGAMSPVEALAHSVSNILREDYYQRPSWAYAVEAGAMLLVALYLISVLPRLKAGMAAIATLILLNVLVDAHFILMATQALWVKLVGPATLLLLGHLLMTTKRFLVTEAGKTRADTESAESNKMLGLAFQGQGQLDMAFDKFRRCPVDPSLLDLLYNLGLDYERKRQFSKAASVYRYMSEYKKDFRDIQNRIQRADAMESTVILGASGPTSLGGTAILQGNGLEKPMLGRYQIEKELGKGAMGVVYLGRDPKINRIVAIKTLPLSQEFDPDEIADVKSRFFREAETAGRLNHPNIVTIFDAGEEQDLAYIAMEFLKGDNLGAFTRASNLLPLSTVFSISFKVAMALDYAHKENVVHRDIKPANIMYEPESGALKITDFGIARITDASRTKTGTVLGTPSYMSPEQLAGRKVDGRSDLFSLGVVIYQLSTGHLPFEADSMATLMYKITNEPHPRPVTVRPDLPPCLGKIIDQCLQKDPDKRYTRGSDLARDLRACAQQLGGKAGGA